MTQQPVGWLGGSECKTNQVSQTHQPKAMARNHGDLGDIVILGRVRVVPK